MAGSPELTREIYPRTHPLGVPPSSEPMHSISDTVRQPVEDISKKSRPNRFQQLFDELHWQFGVIHSTSVVKEIYRAEKRTLKQGSTQDPKSDSDKVNITEIPNPTPEDRLVAARNSGAAGSGRVFIVKAPKPTSF